MNRRHFAALAILAALLIAGCARPQAPAAAVAPASTSMPSPTVPAPTVPQLNAAQAKRRAVVLRELARLQTAAPEQDFATAWANQNTKFIGVYGFTLTLPGVPENRKPALIDKYGVNPVKGTGDYIEFPQTARLNAVATKYATRYNQLLLRKLGEQNAKN